MGKSFILSEICLYFLHYLHCSVAVSAPCILDLIRSSSPLSRRSFYPSFSTSNFGGMICLKLQKQRLVLTRAIYPATLPIHSGRITTLLSRPSLNKTPKLKSHHSSPLISAQSQSASPPLPMSPSAIHNSLIYPYTNPPISSFLSHRTRMSSQAKLANA